MKITANFELKRLKLKLTKLTIIIVEAFEELDLFQLSKIFKEY